jgi:hypothetical protein
MPSSGAVPCVSLCRVARSAVRRAASGARISRFILLSLIDRRHQLHPSEGRGSIDSALISEIELTGHIDDVASDRASSVLYSDRVVR